MKESIEDQNGKNNDWQRSEASRNLNLIIMVIILSLWNSQLMTYSSRAQAKNVLSHQVTIPTIGVMAHERLPRH